MARKLTVGRKPQGHPLKGGSPIYSGGPGYIGARGSAKSAGGGRAGGKKITTSGSGHRVGSSPRGQRSAGSR